MTYAMHMYSALDCMSLWYVLLVGITDVAWIRLNYERFAMLIIHSLCQGLA